MLTHENWRTRVPYLFYTRSEHLKNTLEQGTVNTGSCESQVKITRNQLTKSDKALNRCIEAEKVKKRLVLFSNFRVIIIFLTLIIIVTVSITFFFFFGSLFQVLAREVKEGMKERRKKGRKEPPCVSKQVSTNHKPSHTRPQHPTTNQSVANLGT